MQRMISYYFGRNNFSGVYKELTDQSFEISDNDEHDGISSRKEGSSSGLGHIDAGTDHVYVYPKDRMNEVDIAERSRLLKLLDDFKTV